jgi:hypothetical protein
VQFATPVTVTAGTTYVAAYYAPNGNYAYSRNFFGSPWTNGDGTLSAPAGANGLYRYDGDAFPTNSFNSTNYWVDPLFVPNGPPPSPPTPPSPPAGAQMLFGPSSTPSVANWDDSSAIEAGVRFATSVAGKVHGIRFYKGTANTGSHTGTLWSASGTPIATGTFIETASGWQTLLFTTPVSITAGTTYIASYHTNVGHYALTTNGLSGAYTNGTLSVPAGGAVYLYGGGGFPTTASTHNYWVDVVFVPVQ